MHNCCKPFLENFRKNPTTIFIILYFCFKYKQNSSSYW